MKLYLLLLIFLAFVLLSIFVYFKYYLRYRLHKDMVYICKDLKNNIAFSKDKISELIKSSLSNVHYFTRSVVSKDNKFTILCKKEDVKNISSFIGSLGNGDIDFEINNLNYYENFFDNLHDEAYEKYVKEGKMYPKLLIAIGIVICIILF